MVWSTSIVAGHLAQHQGEARAADDQGHRLGEEADRLGPDRVGRRRSRRARPIAPPRTSCSASTATKAVAFLKAQGIKPAEIQPQSATFEEEFESVEEFKVLPGDQRSRCRSRRRCLKGFVTREAIIVRSADVPRVEKASREVTSLLEQGVSITSERAVVLLHAPRRAQGRDARGRRQGCRARADNILKSTGGADDQQAASTPTWASSTSTRRTRPRPSTRATTIGPRFEKDIITIVHAEFELDGLDPRDARTRRRRARSPASVGYFHDEAELAEPRRHDAPAVQQVLGELADGGLDRERPAPAASSAGRAPCRARARSRALRTESVTRLIGPR